MLDFAALKLSAHRLRAGFIASLIVALVPVALLLPPAAHAQFGAPPTTPVHDAMALKPPPGARVAIVEFEDLQCPDCARANPLLIEASAKYNIPWVRHDFPLPFHNWSFQAAVNARFFDTKSQKLGNDYRDYIFANQISIETPDALRNSLEQKFAAAHNGVALPFAIDPMGKFAGLGQGRLRARPAHRHRAHAHHLGRHQRQECSALCRGRRPHQALPVH
jgi:hypothetical protein